MRIETSLAKASLTRVDQRDPYKVTHKMKVTDLRALAPKFDWSLVFLCQPGAGIRDSECGSARVLQGSSIAS